MPEIGEIVVRDFRVSLPGVSENHLTVSELTELVAQPQSTVSQHLGVLRREGLVKVRREAQTQNYSLAGNEARAILETLQALYCDPRPVDA